MTITPELQREIIATAIELNSAKVDVSNLNIITKRAHELAALYGVDPLDIDDVVHGIVMCMYEYE